MATARRRSQPQEPDLYGPGKPVAWLSLQELSDMSAEAQHRLAATRRRAAVEEYARQHRMLIGDVERQFMVRPDHRSSDRAARCTGSLKNATRSQARERSECGGCAASSTPTCLNGASSSLPPGGDPRSRDAAGGGTPHRRLRQPRLVGLTLRSWSG